MTDQELLEQFAREGAQDAFSELVSRHLNFVYSSARRQVLSPHLVEEVTQSVFLKLAQNAAKLDTHTPLTAWLYVVTRRTALNVMRTEKRRRAREHAAFELTAMNSTPSGWAKVEPLLEEALDELNPHDRSAVLLRYFENKSLRDVGTALGISDDAAHKRVSRALDQLRNLLAKRGFAVTAAGLATDLSAHAIESAPASLGTGIAGALTTAGLGTSALVKTTTSVAMTAFQKVALVTSFVLSAGAAVYSGYGAHLWREKSTVQGNELSSIRAQFGRLQSERNANLAELQSLRKRLDEANRAASKTGAYPAIESELRAWLARESQLRQAFSEDPSLRIPELDLLTADDWANVAETAKLDSPEQVRQALAALRTKARNTFGWSLQAALRAYAISHDGALPGMALELAPHFDPPINPEILGRYDMLRQGKLYNYTQPNGLLWSDDAIIGRVVVDPEYDTVQKQNHAGIGTQPFAEYWAAEGKAAFMRDHAGLPPTTVADLLPYVPATLTPELLARYFKL